MREALVDELKRNVDISRQIVHNEALEKCNILVEALNHPILQTYRRLLQTGRKRKRSVVGKLCRYGVF